MTPDLNKLVEDLLDPNFEGSFQHLRSWSEIDRLSKEAANAITNLKGEVERLTGERGEDIEPPTPLGALKFRMEQGGHTQADLAKLIGSRARASEILAGKRELSKRQIAIISDTWGIPARSLLGADATDWKHLAQSAQAALALMTERLGALDHQRFGSPPEPVTNPSEAWCDAYADWYHQGQG